MEEVFQRKVSEKTSRLEASQLELVTFFVTSMKICGLQSGGSGLRNYQRCSWNLIRGMRFLYLFFA